MNYFCKVERHDDIDIEEWINGFQILLKGSRFKTTCAWILETDLYIPKIVVHAASLFLSRDDQINFCFFVYDIEDSGFITRS